MKSYTIPVSPLPGRPLDKLTADMANHARCIRELQQFTDTGKRRRRDGDVVLPYHPKLTVIPPAGIDPETYEVTLTQGWVAEIKPAVSDAIEYHEADNHYSAPDILENFAMEIGDALYIVVKVGADGTISGSAPLVTIEVDADNTASTHYEPRVDDLDTSGTAGTMYYKICSLVADGDTAKIKHYLSKGNIIYMQELPAILSAGGGGTNIAIIPKEYKESDNSYRLRDIEGGSGINVTQQTDTILIEADPDYSYPYAHPWKVTPNGDDTVDIAAGCIMSWEEQSLTLRNFKKYDGTQTITVSGTGYIYGYIDAALATTSDINAGGTDSNGDTFEVPINRVFPDDTDTITLAYGASVPTSSSIFYFEIAEVTVAAGVASVTYQTLTHNPTIASWIEPP